MLKSTVQGIKSSNVLSGPNARQSGVAALGEQVAGLPGLLDVSSHFARSGTLWKVSGILQSEACMHTIALAFGIST